MTDFPPKPKGGVFHDLLYPNSGAPCNQTACTRIVPQGPRSRRALMKMRAKVIAKRRERRRENRQRRKKRKKDLAKQEAIRADNVALQQERQYWIDMVAMKEQGKAAAEIQHWWRRSSAVLRWRARRTLSRIHDTMRLWKSRMADEILAARAGRCIQTALRAHCLLVKKKEFDAAVQARFGELMILRRAAQNEKMAAAGEAARIKKAEYERQAISDVTVVDKVAKAAAKEETRILEAANVSDSAKKAGIAYRVAFDEIERVAFVDNGNKVEEKTQVMEDDARLVEAGAFTEETALCIEAHWVWAMLERYSKEAEVVEVVRAKRQCRAADELNRAKVQTGQQVQAPSPSEAVDAAVQGARMTEYEKAMKRKISMHGFRIKRLESMVASRVVRMRGTMIAADAAAQARVLAAARIKEAEEAHRKHMMVQRAIALVAKASGDKIVAERQREFATKEMLAAESAEQRRAAAEEEAQVQKRLATVANRLITKHHEALLADAPAVIRARARYAEGKLEKEMVALEAQLAGMKKSRRQEKALRQRKVPATSLQAVPFAVGIAKDADARLAASNERLGTKGAAAADAVNTAEQQIEGRSRANVEELAVTVVLPRPAEVLNNDEAPESTMRSDSVVKHKHDVDSGIVGLEPTPATPSATPSLTPPLSPLQPIRKIWLDDKHPGVGSSDKKDQKDYDSYEGKNDPKTGASSSEHDKDTDTTSTYAVLPSRSAPLAPYSYNPLGSMFLPPLAKSDVMSTVSQIVMQPGAWHESAALQRAVQATRSGRMDAPTLSWLIRCSSRESAIQELERRGMKFVGPTSAPQQYVSGSGIEDLLGQISARNRAGTRFLPPPSRSPFLPSPLPLPRQRDAASGRKSAQIKLPSRLSTRPRPVIYANMLETVGSVADPGGGAFTEGAKVLSVAEWRGIYGSCDDGPLLCAWTF